MRARVSEICMAGLDTGGPPVPADWGHAYRRLRAPVMRLKRADAGCSADPDAGFVVKTQPLLSGKVLSAASRLDGLSRPDRDEESTIPANRNDVLRHMANRNDVLRATAAAASPCVPQQVLICKLGLRQL